MDKLTARDRRRVAVAADVDPRTVQNRVDGLRVQPAMAERIDKALRDLGLAAYVPKEDEKK